MVHITGGGFTKIKDFLSNNTDAIITKNHNLKPQKIFFELYKKGVSDKEMYRIFNCGIGFILGVNKKQAKEILKEIKKEFKADIIGEIKKGEGKIKIQSKFSNKEIEY
jgi:phosphoribosylformylglycinamidine cyclo-ligase